MLKRALTAGAAVLAAAACAETTTDPTGPIQAAVVAKVPLCHWDATTGQFALIMVPGGGKPYQKHLAHGYGEPGGAVPGTPGYVFDDACVPVLAERVFAIAYTDVDPNDGPGFKHGTDVLIAKLVDADRSGSATAGHQVVMGQYPKTFAATAFGSWQVTAHTVILVGRHTSGAGFLYTPNGKIWFFARSTADETDLEEYREERDDGSIAVSISDGSTTRLNQDSIVIRVGSLSAAADLLEGFDHNAADDRFIDVEIYPWDAPRLALVAVPPGPAPGGGISGRCVDRPLTGAPQVGP